MASRMFTLVGASLGALLLIAVSTAYAAEEPGSFQYGQPSGASRGFDVNGDGLVSSQEMLAVLTEPFKRFDRNGDSVVSEAEIRATVEQAIDRIVERVVRRFDADRDGRITRDEFDRFTRERLSGVSFDGNTAVRQGDPPGIARLTIR